MIGHSWCELSVINIAVPTTRHSEFGASDIYTVPAQQDWGSGQGVLYIHILVWELGYVFDPWEEISLTNP